MAYTDMPNNEIEIKLDLQNESNYRRLLDHFPEKTGGIRQENHFFDTSDGKLGKSGWALRIRLADNVAELTAKGPSASHDRRIAIREEISQIIPPQQLRKFLNEGFGLSEISGEIPAALSGMVSNENLKSVVKFVNFRIDAPYSDGDQVFNLEIDRTVFPDSSIDYELELELDSAAEFESSMSFLFNLLRSLAIPIRHQEKSKYERARLRFLKDNIV